MKKGETGRGFNSFRTHVEKKGSARYIASCKSCKFQNDNGECVNNEVTQYDMVNSDDGREFCCYWKGISIEEDPNKKEKKKKDWEW